MPWYQAGIPSILAEKERYFNARVFFLVVPTLLWQEQKQITISHLHLLPVEPRPSRLHVPACLAPGGQSILTKLPATPPPCSLNPTTLSCCVSWGRPCESELLPCSSCYMLLCPCPTVTQTVVLTTTGFRRVPGSGLRRPLARFAAAVYKSPPTAAPGEKSEITSRDMTMSVGVHVIRAGCHCAYGDVSAGPALSHGPSHTTACSQPEVARAELGNKDTLARVCLLPACQQAVGRTGPLLPTGQYCCFPPPVQHHQSETS